MDERSNSLAYDSSSAPANPTPESDDYDGGVTGNLLVKTGSPLDRTDPPIGAGAEFNEFALRRQEMALQRSREHVTFLQDSLSTLSAAGAQLATLLNRRTRAYETLVSGLNSLLSTADLHEPSPGYIDASSYDVLSSTGPVEALDEPMPGSSPAGGAPPTEYPDFPPVDVDSILRRVEALTLGFREANDAQSLLESLLVDRDAEIAALTEDLAALGAQVETQSAARGDAEALLLAREMELEEIEHQIDALQGELGSLIPASDAPATPSTGEVAYPTLAAPDGDSLVDDSPADDLLVVDSSADETAVELKPEPIPATDSQRVIGLAAVQAGVTSALQVIGDSERSIDDLSTQVNALGAQLAQSETDKAEIATLLAARDQELDEIQAWIDTLQLDLQAISAEPAPADEDADTEAATPDGEDDSDALSSDENANESGPVERKVSGAEKLSANVAAAIEIIQAQEVALGVADSDIADLQAALAEIQGKVDAQEESLQTVQARVVDYQGILQAALQGAVQEDIAPEDVTPEDEAPEDSLAEGDQAAVSPAVAAAPSADSPDPDAGSDVAAPDVAAPAPDALITPEAAVEALGATIAAAVATIQTRDRALAAAVDEQQALEAKIASAQDSLHTLETDRESLNTQMTALQGDLASLGGENAATAAALASSQQALAEVNARIDALRDELQATLPGAEPETSESGSGDLGDAAAQETPAGIDALDAQVKAAIALLQQQDLSLADANSNNSDLIDRLSSLADDFDGQSTRLGETEAQLSAREQALNDLLAQIADIQTTLRDGFQIEPGPEQTETTSDTAFDTAADSSATDSSATDSSAADSSVTDSSVTDSSVTDSSVTDSSAADSAPSDSQQGDTPADPEPREVGNVTALATAVSAAIYALRSKDQIIRASNISINALEERTKTLDEQRSALQAQLDEASQATVDAQARGDALQSAIDDLNTQREALEAQVGDLTGQIEALNSQVEVLNADLAAAQNDKAGLEAKLSALEEEFAQTKEADEASLAESVARIGTLSAAAAVAAATADEKESEIRAAQDRIAALEAEGERLRASMEQTADLLAARSEEIASAKPRLVAYEEELAILAEERDLALTHLNEYETELADSQVRAALLAAFPPKVALALNRLGAIKAEAAHTAQLQGVDPVIKPLPQDLVKVKQIGKIYEQRLHAANVGTYWEVASLSDEEFHQIFEPSEMQLRRLNFDEIRVDAARLATETESVGQLWEAESLDDFEPIEGIGRVFEQRLYAAGIRTYRALAETPVERLAEICKAPRLNQPDYASSITQAQGLMKE